MSIYAVLMIGEQLFPETVDPAPTPLISYLNGAFRHAKGPVTFGIVRLELYVFAMNKRLLRNTFNAAAILISSHP